MFNLSPEAVIFIAYVICLVGPPLLAVPLFAMGTSELTRYRAVPLFLSGLILLGWMPLVALSTHILPGLLKAL